MQKKTEIDRDTLYRLYVERNYTRKEIGKLYNLKEDRVKTLLKRYNLIKPKVKICELRQAIQTAEHRKKLSKIQKKVRNTPESKVKTSIASKKNWQSKEYRQKQQKIYQKQLADPEFHKKRSELSKKMWQSSEYREKRKLAIQKFYITHPEARKKRSELSKSQWKREEVKKKHKASAKISLNSPEYIKKARIQNFKGLNLDIYLDDSLFIEKIKELKTLYNVCKFFNVSHSCILKRLKNLPEARNLLLRKKSNPENDLFIYIQSIYKGEIIRNSRLILNDHLEIDFYLPELKLGIEFNGIYWHSTKKVPNDYHFNKVMKAKEVGISLLQIWEHDWEKKKGIIQTKIYNIINHKFDILKNSQVLSTTSQFQLIETPLEYYDYSFFASVKDYIYTPPTVFFVHRGNYKRVNTVYNKCIVECYNEGTIIWKNYLK